MRKKQKKETVADRVEVLQFLTGLLRGELRETTVGKDGSRVENEAGLKERLRAAELLGKGCGAFSVEEAESGTEEWKVEIEIVNETEA